MSDEAVDQGLDLIHHAADRRANENPRRIGGAGPRGRKLARCVSVQRPRPSPFMISMIFLTSYFVGPVHVVEEQQHLLNAAATISKLMFVGSS